MVHLCLILAKISVMKNQYSILNSESPRNGWEEMIKDEIEKHGQSDNSIPDFFDDENNDWTW